MSRPPSNRRSWILKAATKLFSQQGFPDVKLDKVAESARVAKGTIYLYFKNKEELFCECLLDGHEEFLKKIDKTIAKNDPSLARLKTLVRLQASYFSQKGPLIQQMLHLGPSHALHPALITRVVETRRLFVDVLSRLFDDGLNSGEFDCTLNSRQMAIMFLQFFDLNFKFQIFGEPSLNAEEVYEILVKIFQPS